VTPSGFKPETF